MICDWCGDSYPKNPTSPTSLLCVECRKAYHSERAKGWQARHRDLVNARQRARHAANPEKHREQTRIYAAKNREAVYQRTQDWRARNPEKLLEYQRKWRAEHPDRVAANHRTRYIRRRDVEHENYGGLRGIFERDGGRCAYCGVEVFMEGLPSRNKQTAVVDHVAPLRDGGPDVGWNVVLTCFSCNSRKKQNHIDTVFRAEETEMQLAR